MLAVCESVSRPMIARVAIDTDVGSEGEVGAMYVEASCAPGGMTEWSKVSPSCMTGSSGEFGLDRVRWYVSDGSDSFPLSLSLVLRFWGFRLRVSLFCVMVCPWMLCRLRRL